MCFFTSEGIWCLYRQNHFRAQLTVKGLVKIFFSDYWKVDGKDWNLLVVLVSLSFFGWPAFFFTCSSLLFSRSVFFSFWTNLQPPVKSKNVRISFLVCSVHQVGCHWNYLRLPSLTLLFFSTFQVSCTHTAFPVAIECVTKGTWKLWPYVKRLPYWKQQCYMKKCSTTACLSFLTFLFHIIFPSWYAS